MLLRVCRTRRGLGSVRMSGGLPFASGNIVDDLLGCFGLGRGSVSVYLCTCISDKGVG